MNSEPELEDSCNLLWKNFKEPPITPPPPNSPKGNTHSITGQQSKLPVFVRTVNLAEHIARLARPCDYVVLKMDVEGAEWPILHSMVDSGFPQRQLIDELLCEWHYWVLAENRGDLDFVPDAAEKRRINVAFQKHGTYVPNYETAK